MNDAMPVEVSSWSAIGEPSSVAPGECHRRVRDSLIDRSEPSVILEGAMCQGFPPPQRSRACTRGKETPFTERRRRTELCCAGRMPPSRPRCHKGAVRPLGQTQRRDSAFRTFSGGPDGAWSAPDPQCVGPAARIGAMPIASSRTLSSVLGKSRAFYRLPGSVIQDSVF